MTTGSRNEFFHRPVLADEAVNLLLTRPDGIYVDLTCGGGGHLRLLAERLQPSAVILGIDRDPEALLAARENLKSLSLKIELKNSTFGRLDELLAMVGIKEVDGILIDLGLSSHQIDTAGRGFSFMKDGPLDMRMDSRANLTAAGVVNEYSEARLANIFREYGEERRAARLARVVHEARARQKIMTTLQLVAILKPHLPPRDMNASLARLFQALRIEVNRELEELETVLPKMLRALRSGGRAVVISYHSLEDRRVKRFFAQESRDCLCPPRIPVCVCGHKATVRLLTRKAVKPSSEEISVNRRAQSARLRAVEKL
ncbi:MAG: 16S rRNA (cytosine(1402)-N(4))-methyltransferase RsmH [Candidatus Zixiibacteriota bacterium]